MYIDSYTVTLGWNPSADDHTPTNGLTYNLRIGTSSGAQDILPAMSNPSNGKLLLPKPGNTGNNSDWTINLPDGTYFWSVQAIDHSFAASEFSTEQTFTILNVGIAKDKIEGLTVYPNPVQDILEVSLPKNHSQRTDYTITNMLGTEITTGSIYAIKQNIDLSGIKPGLYFLHINTVKGTVSQKIIKK